jgi:glycogen synthase
MVEFCREKGLALLAISSNERIDAARDGDLRLENRPRKFAGHRGVFYHYSRLSYAVYLAVRAKIFGADLAIVDSGTAHYFALALFRLFAIPVAVNFHNTLWPSGFPPRRRLARLILWLDGWFFRRVAVGALGVSPECGIQLHELAGSAVPFFEYRCQFRIEGFQSSLSVGHRKPFRVAFAGRAEPSKGILDVPAIAQHLRQRSTAAVVFEICGDGSALIELENVIQESNLSDVVHVHGRLARPQLLEVYARAHAIIVPTRSDFCEGMPHVCAEAILSGLPVITSRLSNALPVIGPAISEAQPDDIQTYVEAILRLVEDPAAYDRLKEACPALQHQFLDRSQSYAAATSRLISQIFPYIKPLQNYNSLFARIP